MTLIEPTPPPIQTPPDSPPPARRIPLHIEVLLMLLFTVLPSVFNSLTYLVDPVPFVQQSFTTSYLSTFISLSVLTIPILMILYLNGSNFRQHGIVPIKRIDAFLPVPIVLSLGFAWWCFWMALYRFAPSITQYLADTQSDIDYGTPASPINYLALILGAAAIGWYEEFLFRGYLIPRLEKLTHSTTLAVIFSTIIFSIGHAYQGLAGILNSFLIGLIFALLLIRLRRLWPLAIAHAAYDIFVILLTTRQ